MEREGELIYPQERQRFERENTKGTSLSTRPHPEVILKYCEYPFTVPMINYYLQCKGMVGEHLVGLQSDDRNLAIDPHSECVDKALSWNGDERKQQERHKDEGRMEMSSLKNRSMRSTLICWSTHKWEKTASCQAAGLLTIRQSINFGRKASNCRIKLPNSWQEGFSCKPDWASWDFNSAN